VNFDALTYHIYPNLGLNGTTFQGKCDFDITTDYSQTIINNVDDAMNFAFAYPFETFYNFDLSYQADYASGGPEAWITEYNLDDKNYNYEGRWLHGLFTA